MVEPTVLERPKYQYKPISSDTCVDQNSSSNSPWKQSVSILDEVYAGGTVDGDVISADFRMNKDLYGSKMYENVPFYLSPGPHNSNDLDYQEFLRLNPILKYVPDGWIKQYPDAGGVNSVENHPEWSIPVPNGNQTIFISQFSLGQNIAPGFYYTGSGYFYLNNCYYYTKTNETIKKVVDSLEKNLTAPINLSFIRNPTQTYKSTIRSGIILDIENPEELGVHCDNSGRIIETKLSGSDNRYIIKNWNKENIWYRVGEYAQPQTVNSQSVLLYKTEVWKGISYEDLVYTSSISLSLPLTDLYGPNLSQYSPKISTDANKKSSTPCPESFITWFIIVTTSSHAD